MAQERAKAETDRAALVSQVEELRRQEQSLYAQITEAASAEARTLRTELQVTRDRLAALEDERAAGERIVREFGPGVCMIQGAYVFQDADGRPLRLRLDEDGAPAGTRTATPCWTRRAPAPSARSSTWEPAFSWTGGASS